MKKSRLALETENGRQPELDALDKTLSELEEELKRHADLCAKENRDRCGEKSGGRRSGAPFRA